MQANITQGLQVLRRTSAFLEQEIDIPAKMGPISKHVEALNKIVDRVASLAAEQHASDRGYQDASRKARELSRAIVREYVRPVALSGKVLYPVESPIRSTLKIPRGGALSYEALIAVVEGIADRLEDHKAQFIEAGFELDVTDTLRGAVEELRKALAEKAMHFGRRSAATAGLLLEYGRARNMVRMLDAMVAPRLEGTEHLAQWKTLSLFPKETRREEKADAESSTVLQLTSTPSTPAANGVDSRGDEDAA